MARSSTLSRSGPVVPTGADVGPAVESLLREVERDIFDKSLRVAHLRELLSLPAPKSFRALFELPWDKPDALGFTLPYVEEHLEEDWFRECHASRARAAWVWLAFQEHHERLSLPCPSLAASGAIALAQVRNGDWMGILLDMPLRVRGEVVLRSMERVLGATDARDPNPRNTPVIRQFMDMLRGWSEERVELETIMATVPQGRTAQSVDVEGCLYSGLCSLVDESEPSVVPLGPEFELSKFSFRCLHVTHHPQDPEQEPVEVMDVFLEVLRDYAVGELG